MMKSYIYPYYYFINKKAFYWIVIVLLFMLYTYDHVQVNYGLSYSDEIIMVFLFLCWMMKAKHKSKEFSVLLCIFCVYLINSFIDPHNVTVAILSDFIQQLKPFVAFYCIYDLGIYLNARWRRRLRRLCVLLVIVMFPVGYINMGGGDLMNNLFGGHARFSSLAICLGTTYYYFSNRNKHALLVCFMIYSVGLFSTRSKMFGFYAAVVIIFFLWNIKNKKIKLVNLKNILILVVLLVGVCYAAREKIQFYFVDGYNASNMFARPLLYVKALEILEDFPFLGTGFGSYATDASAQFYSPLYYQYGLYLSPEIGNGSFISDTWFPVLAQFGYVGVFLYALFWRCVFLKAKAKYELMRNSSELKIAILIMVYMFIESVADSTFTQNRGMYMMMLLALSVRCTNVDCDTAQCA